VPYIRGLEPFLGHVKDVAYCNKSGWTENQHIQHNYQHYMHDDMGSVYKRASSCMLNYATCWVHTIGAPVSRCTVNALL
jgi:hypothetical protein